MAFTFRSVGKFLGKAAKVAAPVVGMVNPALGVALGAAGGLGNGKDSLRQMAGGAIGGGAGALAGRAGGIAGGGFMDKARGALDKIGGVDTLIGAASAYDGYRADREAQKYRKMAMNHANQQWQAGAPLREAGMRDLLDETQPDLSHLYGASENPFRRVRGGY